jgi:hypothetical protein
MSSRKFTRKEFAFLHQINRDPDCCSVDTCVALERNTSTRRSKMAERGLGIRPSATPSACTRRRSCARSIGSKQPVTSGSNGGARVRAIRTAIG